MIIPPSFRPVTNGHSEPNGTSIPQSEILPIINITPYLLDEQFPGAAERRAATSAAIHEACINFGFFYLDISAFADPRDTEELASLAREFFSLPQEEKDKLALSNQDHARGYARLKENVTNGKADNHEGLDFYRPVENPDKNKPLWGENQWPTIPGFREKYEKWIEKMKMLGPIVMEAYVSAVLIQRVHFVNVEQDGYWSGSSVHILFNFGYPPLPDDHNGFSCGAHRDYGCLTFLYADPTPNALQVLVQRFGIGADVAGLPVEQGNEEGVWISANPIPGCVVCNIGEMWEIWTNGLYKSTLHRVIHRGTNYRVSIPFFFEPNFDAVVKPLDAALRIQDSRKEPPSDKQYKPVKYGDFLLGKVSNNFAGGGGKYD
uniref:Fe2OG dioxygenase domain-containing protein n=1 Tax=Moniliophthora roreri TaxID=221103 RepID=A0A0W0F3Y2_MONRR